MRVLLDNTAFLPICGGTETYCYQLLTNISPDEAQLRLFCQVPPKGPSILNGHQILRIGDHGLPEGYHPNSEKNDLAMGMGRILASKADAFQSLERLKSTTLNAYYEKLIDFDPEIVLVNDLMRIVSVPYIQHAFFITDPKIIVNLHGILTSFESIWTIKPEKKRLVDKLISSNLPLYFLTPSKFVYDTALKWGIDEERLQLIYLGVDTSFFTIPSEEEKIQARTAIDSKFSKSSEFGSNEILISFPSRAVDHKGADTAVQALKLLKSDQPELKWKLLIAGGASDNPESIEETIKLVQKIEDRVLLGMDLFVDFPADMRLFHQACDLCLFPSRREALGYGALESMASGVPVIGTSIPGLSEALGVTPGEEGPCPAGWAVKPEDPKSLSQAIEQALSSSSILQNKGKEARVWVEGQFSLDRMIGEHIQLFKEITLN